MRKLMDKCKEEKVALEAEREADRKTLNTDDYEEANQIALDMLIKYDGVEYGD